MEKRDELLSLLYLFKIEKLKERKSRYDREYSDVLTEKKYLEESIAEINNEIIDSKDIIYALSTYKSSIKEIVKKEVVGPTLAMYVLTDALLFGLEWYSIPASLLVAALIATDRYLTTTKELRELKKQCSYESECEIMGALMSKNFHNRAKLYGLDRKLERLNSTIFNLNADIMAFEYLYNELIALELPPKTKIIKEAIELERPQILLREKLEK